MVRVGVSTASLHLKDALGSPWYELDVNNNRMIGSMAKPPTFSLLEMPAEVASNRINTVDICIQHIPSIESSYLTALRAALEASKVELFQLLIDLGNVSSLDRTERNASIDLTKRWMTIAAELGATGVRYVPGDSEPTPKTIRLSGEAFYELANYANQRGLKPATENYKTMNNTPENLLQIIELSGQKYGLIADFGNASGSNKYDTLAKLMPQATAIHAWAEYDADGVLMVEDFQYCLKMARDNGFDGPIMLLGGRPTDVYKRTRDLWGGIDELRQQVKAVFG